jgi:hypothetical protein
VLPPLLGFDIEREIAIAALPCASREQALAARAAWGRGGPTREGADTVEPRRVAELV